MIRARRKQYPLVWKAASDLADHVAITCDQATRVSPSAFSEPEWTKHHEELTELLTALTDAVEAECS
jgi:hypothetical protein